MIKGIVTAGVLAAGIAGVTSASAAVNLITNGSFETGNFSGFTTNFQSTDGYAPVVIKYGQASTYPTGAFGEAIPVDPFTDPATGQAAGSYGAYFSSDRTAGDSISQNVALVSGTTYLVSFDYYLPFNGQVNAGPGVLTLFVDGVTKAVFTASAQAGGQWYQYASTFVADTSGTNNNLTFTFTSPGPGTYGKDFVIDVLSVAAVPESATWAMMVAGFGLMGAAMRRKRTAVVFG